MAKGYLGGIMYRIILYSFLISMTFCGSARPEIHSETAGVGGNNVSTIPPELIDFCRKAKKAYFDKKADLEKRAADSKNAFDAFMIDFRQEYRTALTEYLKKNESVRAIIVSHAKAVASANAWAKGTNPPPTEDQIKNLIGSIDRYYNENAKRIIDEPTIIGFSKNTMTKHGVKSMHQDSAFGTSTEFYEGKLYLRDFMRDTYPEESKGGVFYPTATLNLTDGDIIMHYVPDSKSVEAHVAQKETIFSAACEQILQMDEMQSVPHKK